MDEETVGVVMQMEFTLTGAAGVDVCSLMLLWAVLMTVTREGADLVLVVVMLVLERVTLATLTTDKAATRSVGGFGGGPLGRRGGNGGGLPFCSRFFRRGGFSIGATVSELQFTVSQDTPPFTST